MTKFTLIAEESFDDSKVTLEFYAELLPVVLEHMERFIKANGFVVDGQLDFVDNCEEMSDEEDTWSNYWVDRPQYDTDLPSNSWPFGINAATFKGR